MFTINKRKKKKKSNKHTIKSPYNQNQRFIYLARRVFRNPTFNSHFNSSRDLDFFISAGTLSLSFVGPIVDAVSMSYLQVHGMLR